MRHILSTNHQPWNASNIKHEANEKVSRYFSLSLSPHTVLSRSPQTTPQAKRQHHQFKMKEVMRVFRTYDQTVGACQQREKAGSTTKLLAKLQLEPNNYCNSPWKAAKSSALMSGMHALCTSLDGLFGWSLDSLWIVGKFAGYSVWILGVTCRLSLLKLATKSRINPANTKTFWSFNLFHTGLSNRLTSF